MALATKNGILGSVWPSTPPTAGPSTKQSRRLRRSCRRRRCAGERRHVGDVGLRHHDVGTHHAADKSREQDEGQGLADGGHDHHDRKAENARKQHGTPSDAVRKGAEDGREEELHQAVAHHDCAVPAGLQVARVSERSDEPRKNRNNEPMPSASRKTQARTNQLQAFSSWDRGAERS